MIDVIGMLIVPSGIIILLILIAIICLCRSSLRRFGRWALFAAIGVYAVFGNGVVAFALLGPLENWHAPVTRAADLGRVDLIVVLTGHAARLETVSPASWMNASSAYRIIEALWIKAAYPDARLLVSGNIGSAWALREVLLSLGLPPDQVAVDAPAVDTAQSAFNLQDSVRAGEVCVLITSAGHMPRAILAFERRGLTCRPVPTEWYTPFELGIFDYLPSPKHLKLSDHAIHEYVGIAWYRLIGKL